MVEVLPPAAQAQIARYWLGIVQHWLRADGTLGARVAAFVPVVPWSQPAPEVS